MPHRVRVQSVFPDGDEVVAVDDGGVWKAVITTDFDLGWDASDRPSDWGTRDSIEHGDDAVASQNADGSSSPFFSEVCPIDIVASYHSGAVSAANRSEALSNIGSGG